MLSNSFVGNALATVIAALTVQIVFVAVRLASMG
jgi:hypothetical protein